MTDLDGYITVLWSIRIYAQLGFYDSALMTLNFI